MLLSIILPVYNEEEALPLFLDTLRPVLRTLEETVAVEVIMVDDGSRDGSLAAIQAAQAADGRLRYVSFSRNFGKEAAMLAGMAHARGDYVAIMDVDLQDPPELLPQMLHGIQAEGYDCVASRRVARQGEPPIRSAFARLFYRLINRVSTTEIVDGARDFRMMTRQMTDAVLSLRERNRFSKGLFSWVGYQTKWLEYENLQRVAGETKWSFWSLAVYAMQGFAAFSNAPLAMAAFGGLAFCLVALALGIALLWHPGSMRLLIACLAFLIGGAQLLASGVIGLYLAKTHTETRARPLYVVRKTGGLSKEE